MEVFDLWEETGKGRYLLFLDERNLNHKVVAIIFDDVEMCGHYTYIINKNRHVTQGNLKASDLEGAKKEVETIIQNKEYELGNYIHLYYSLDYYILIPENKDLIVDNEYIQVCPPERFRERRIEELKKIKGVAEIRQCNGALLSDRIKMIMYREKNNFKTVYDALRYSGKLLWKAPTKEEH